MTTSQLKVKATDANKVSSPNSLKVTTTVVDDKKKPKKEEAKKEPTPIDEKMLKSEWNKFISWMKSKKQTGKEELNHNNLGNELFKQWQAETKSPLTVENMPNVRQLILKTIQQQKDALLNSKGNYRAPLPGSGKLVYGEEARPIADKIGSSYIENEKSKNPNYIGSLFSKWEFPYLEITEKGKKDAHSMKTISELNQNRDTTVPQKITRTL
jgi:hypothetical protein